MFICQHFCHYFVVFHGKLCQLVQICSFTGVRNCFELERADPNDGFDDDVIHYGQNFRIKMLPFSKIS